MCLALAQLISNAGSRFEFASQHLHPSAPRASMKRTMRDAAQSFRPTATFNAWMPPAICHQLIRRRGPDFSPTSIAR